MLIRGMVEDHIHHDLDPALMCFFHQPVKICQGAKFWVHAAILTDVIPKILIRGRVDGGEPDGIHPQPLQVIEPG